MGDFTARYFLLILGAAIILCSFVPSVNSWRTHPRPKWSGDKIPIRRLIPNNARSQKKIVVYHNYFRSKVSPPAADMLKMRWHKGAAKTAQYWADQCRMLQHDSNMDRWDEHFGTCGQNIFISTLPVAWRFAIKTWYSEKDNFTYGSSHNDLHVVGHYTQMVWSKTHRVGCGFSKCRTPRGQQYYSYVCNYCPIGNFKEQLGNPYKRGKPCSECPNHCHAQKLCTNSCPRADQWVNCRDLANQWRSWLCNDSSDDGINRRQHCKATCGCKNRLY